LHPKPEDSGQGLGFESIGVFDLPRLRKLGLDDTRLEAYDLPKI